MMNEWILSSSLLISAVLLVRFALRGRISLRLQYALWVVVLVRLLLPVQLFTSSIGAGSMARHLDLSEPVRQVYHSAREDHYEQEYDEAYQKVVARYEAAHQQLPDAAVIEQAAQEQTQTSLKLDLQGLLNRIWLAGMGVMTAVIAGCNLHLSRRLRRRRYDLDAADCLLPVYITDAVPTPCIFGFFRPAIYLTPESAKDDRARAHVLAHELTHYRHLDHIWSVLRSVCLVLHWYNPLVWLAAKVSRADAELACDEGALAKLGEEQRGDYGRTLIGLTCPDRGGSLFVAATTMTGSAGSLRERIRLLMQRPRNTALTVTAVILLVTLIVGCSFSGAPETTQTGPQQSEPTAPSEHLPDSDMSYTGQELPILEDPTASDFGADNGLLVFPGTRWGMTEEELLEALDIQEYGIFSGLRGIHLPDTDFCGYPASVSFLFDHYRSEDAWGLTGVQVQFADEDTANAVYSILYAQLGQSDSWTSGVASCAWWSDSTLKDLISPEAWAVYQDEHPFYIYDGQSEDQVAASAIVWYGGGIPGQENMVSFSSGLHLARQIEATIAPDQATEVAALFVEGGDPWYLAALAAPYADYNSFDAVTFFSAGQTAVALTDAETAAITEAYGKDALQHTIFRMTEERMDAVLERYVGTMVWNVDLSEFVFCHETGAYLLVRDEVPQLRVPEILSCEQLAKDQVCMIYRFPGEAQRYCATLLKGKNWAVYSNHLLLEKPLNARSLTEQEAATVRLSFSPGYYDAATDETVANPRAAFLLDMYSDIREMSRSKFLSYYPATEYCEDEAEFQLLKQKYPESFETEQTIRDMNWPIHRIPASELEAVMEEYTLVNWEDLSYDGWYHYLEETDCYYTYYSDVGLFGFHCTGGWVYDGGAMLYNNFSTPMSVLILTEHDGRYYIQAHLPALVAP